MWGPRQLALHHKITLESILQAIPLPQDEEHNFEKYIIRKRGVMDQAWFWDHIFYMQNQWCIVRVDS